MSMTQRRRCRCAKWWVLVGTTMINGAVAAGRTGEVKREGKAKDGADACFKAAEASGGLCPRACYAHCSEV